MITISSVNKEVENFEFDDQERTAKSAKDLELLFDILNNIKFPEIPDFLPLAIDEKYFFNIITDKKTLIDAFRLRFLAYSDQEVGYINAKKFPLGIEFDIYDKVSVHIYAKNLETEKLCGYMRMIKDTPMGLQLETHFDISDYRKSFKICEGSRFISYPRRQPLVSRTLYEILKKIVKHNGIQKLLGESRLAQKNFFDKLGQVPMEPFRSWELHKKKEWGVKRKDIIYGSIAQIDQEVVK